MVHQLKPGEKKMSQEEVRIKEVPGLRRTVVRAMVGNAIRMAIVVLASWGVAFHSFGPSKGIGTLMGFIACVIPFFTILEPYNRFNKAKAELVKGAWELKEDEAWIPAEPFVNSWNLLLPRALIYGFGAMLPILALIGISGREPSELAVVLIVLIVNIVTTTHLIRKYLPRHLLSFAAALKGAKTTKPQPLSSYLTIEHIIPFFLLQAYLTGCIANRSFHFMAEKAGLSYVPISSFVVRMVIAFYILALVQWMFSSILARGDVPLGRVQVYKLKKIGIFAGIGYIFGAGILLGVVYRIILHFGHVPGLSVETAIAFNTAVVALSVVLGAWIGVRRSLSGSLPGKNPSIR